MLKPDCSRDLEALIKATEDNRAELKKTQQKMDTLEAAIKTMKNARLESEQRRGKRNPK
jgi:hypothetical protein